MGSKCTDGSVYECHYECYIDHVTVQLEGGNYVKCPNSKVCGPNHVLNINDCDPKLGPIGKMHKSFRKTVEELSKKWFKVANLKNLSNLKNCPSVGCTWKYTPASEQVTRMGASNAGVTCQKCEGVTFCCHC
jgi:hypothetical protein